MKNTHWLRVDERELNQPSRVSTRSGIEIELYVSPYDVPKAVNGSYDEEKGRFCITFSYITADEPTKRVEKDPNVAFLVGRHSGRLYSMEVNVDAMRAGQVKLTVQELIHNAIDAFSTQRPSPNHRIARQVIDEKSDQLLCSLGN